jgi:hypothetical protein
VVIGCVRVYSRSFQFRNLEVQFSIAFHFSNCYMYRQRLLYVGKNVLSGTKIQSVYVMPNMFRFTFRIIVRFVWKPLMTVRYAWLI